jgi:UDP-arabinose 4-epimerase
MTSVLVVGGAGYIGSHCCKALAKAGLTPVVYDNLTTGHRAFARFGPLIEGDVRDQETLAATLRDIRPIGIMHFAALSLVGDSVADPGAYYDNNVVGTLRLLSAMRDFGVRSLVFSSTCAVYGEPAAVPVTESERLKPVSPYGATKRACEQMMDDFDHAHGIRSVRLRYFNAAGADPDCEIGERHEPETHLIPLAFDAALERRPPLQVFGTDYPTPDGTAIRDYIHVTDLAAAHLAGLDHLGKGGATLAVNLGTGTGASVAEVVASVERVTGLAVPRENAPRRSGDPAKLVADPELAATTLGWCAGITGLDAIVKDAWEWHRRLNS